MKCNRRQRSRGVRGGLMLALLLLCAPAMAVETLSVGAVQASRTAAEIAVDIRLSNADVVGGFDLRLEYDGDRLEVLDVRTAARTEGFELFSANTGQAGTVILLGIADFLGGDSVPPLDAGEGPIATVIFRPLPAAPAGIVPLDLTEGSLSNPTGSQLTQAALEDGWIELEVDVESSRESMGALKSAYQRR